MDPLVERLTPTAQRAALLTLRYVREEMRHVKGRPTASRDHDNHALVAAFEAYLTLGGHVDRPDEFPWEEKSAALFRETLRRLNHTYRGAHTAIADKANRMRYRTERVSEEPRWWDGWGTPIHEGGARTRDWNKPEAYGTAKEDPEEDAHIADILDLMRSTLPPRSYNWMVARYVYNINIQTLIDDFVADHPEYAGPEGRRRAQGLIDTAISRARSAVRKALKERATACR